MVINVHKLQAKPPKRHVNLNKQVNVRVLDVDEPPVFFQAVYYFTVLEESMTNHIGTITARDPDKANKNIRYHAV